MFFLTYVQKYPILQEKVSECSFWINIITDDIKESNSVFLC